MTVGELIEKLRTLPAQDEVVVFNGDMHNPSRATEVTIVRTSDLDDKYPEFVSDSAKGQAAVLIA
ncbi:hypothetical protein [Mesorhizobium sp. B2-8-9]|uniref:hypothetical protein n=1 Tax=Mesorhizobium sp. B2-8-9 TaxID=2589899 RepID=UPI00112AB740|nr:hypothetical protein [Mesorhizobium sp. B2-8-9]TPI86420.1 hypothetical protein FJ423_00935 [Mesorhizobium sp. B2-8-9]